MADTFRVTTYEINAGTFTGLTYTLNLTQDLEDNYFTMIIGGGGTGNSGSGYNFCRITSDPQGTGILAASGATDQIVLTRGISNAGVNDWEGTVTVVECLGDVGASGFVLNDVVEVTISGTGSSDQSGDIIGLPEGAGLDNTIPFGGLRGGGVESASTATNTASACHGTFTISVSPDKVDWTRNNAGGAGVTATATVHVVTWGTEWDIQHVQSTGSAGGGGANVIGEYNTTTITSVTRDQTWVWGCGYTADGGIGDSFSGTLVTLGDGVTQLTSETSVAVGQEYSDTRVVEVYVLSHTDAAVDYRFKADGDSTLFTFSHTVDAAIGSESYSALSGVDRTLGKRFGLQYNGCNGTGTAFPRPYWGVRHQASTTLDVVRRYNGQAWPAWVQSIDLNDITFTPPKGSPRRVFHIL